MGVNVYANWLRDLLTEVDIGKYVAKWTVGKDIPLKSVDLEAGIALQTRLINGLNKEYVSLIRQKMLDGTPYKMGWLNRVIKNNVTTYVPLGACHRLKGSAEAYGPNSTVEAYLVDIEDSGTISLVAHRLNALESSLGYAMEERLQGALHLHVKEGISVKEAAKALDISEELVYSTLRAMEVKTKLADIGVKANGLPKSVLEKLKPLSHNKNILAAIIKPIMVHEMPGDEVKRLVADVKKGGTEKQQLEEITRWEGMLEERSRPQPKNSVKPKVRVRTMTRDAFLRHFTGMVNILENADTLAKLQCTAKVDKLTVMNNWPKLQKAMNHIMKELKGGES